MKLPRLDRASRILIYIRIIGGKFRIHKMPYTDRERSCVLGWIFVSFIISFPFYWCYVRYIYLFIISVIYWYQGLILHDWKYLLLNKRKWSLFLNFTYFRGAIFSSENLFMINFHFYALPLAYLCLSLHRGKGLYLEKVSLKSKYVNCDH